MRIACLGEVMIELRPAEKGTQLTRGIAGDTFNTAVMLSREGVYVRYITQLGSDPFSQEIIDFAQSEGIDSTGVFRHPSAMPGLYLIQNDASGEREFFYWRDSSAARELFSDRKQRDAVLAAVRHCDWLYLSGITVAVMAQHSEDVFLEFLRAVKAAGVSIVFDPNYRPRLWQSIAKAKFWHEMLLSFSELVLPTLEDEQALWGAASAEAVIEKCRAAGARTVVVKCPDALAIACDEVEYSECRTAYQGPVVDTTGAGDAFNAGFLAAKFNGKPLRECLHHAHEVASRVIAIRGALP